MNRFARSMTGMMAACLVTLAVTATSAHAQDAAAGGQRPPALQQGPMVVEPISSGFVLMPEVRWTELNHSWGTQFGASGGWLYDERFFFGGGVYWLVGGAGDQQLTNGGFITGWSAPITRSLHVGVRGLLGWGHADTFEEWTDPGYCQHGKCYGPSTQKAWVYQDFMVFEPSVNATIRLARQLSLDVSGGYRLTGNNHYGSDNHVNGAFGSVGIRVGVF
jgi:hypothetical protein